MPANSVHKLLSFGILLTLNISLYLWIRGVYVSPHPDISLYSRNDSYHLNYLRLFPITKNIVMSFFIAL